MTRKGKPNYMGAVEVGAGFAGAQLVVGQIAMKVPMIGANKYFQAGTKVGLGILTAGFSKSKTVQNIGLGMMAGGAADLVMAVLPPSITAPAVDSARYYAPIGALAPSEIMSRQAANRVFNRQTVSDLRAA